MQDNREDQTMTTTTTRTPQPAVVAPPAKTVSIEESVLQIASAVARARQAHGGLDGITQLSLSKQLRIAAAELTWIEMVMMCDNCDGDGWVGGGEDRDPIRCDHNAHKTGLPMVRFTVPADAAGTFAPTTDDEVDGVLAR
jgi:hypothetical protein